MFGRKKKEVVKKSLSNTTDNTTKSNVSDLTTWGKPDLFVLISKASSEEEGWMKSTKAMQINDHVIVQVTTQQRNPDGSYVVAEALTTINNVNIYNIDANGKETMASKTLGDSGKVFGRIIK